MSQPTDLGSHLRYFLSDFLAAQRNASPNTVRAYRDSLKLLLLFVAARRGGSVADLSLTHIDRPSVLEFLKSTECDRRNQPVTRNLRLAAIRAFFRSVANRSPEAVEHCQQILSIPLKRTEQRAVDYLTLEEVKAIFATIPLTSAAGKRDDCLLRFMYNTGARVQEVVNVRTEDLRLETPAQVRLVGKGRKERLCPLWPDTAARLQALISAAGRQAACSPLFRNRDGGTLTRFGVRYILSTYAHRGAERCPTLARKRVHPHTLRHTTAMHLLQAGVDVNTIRCWLGHVSVTTTNRYVEIDLEMKRRALEQIGPPQSARRRRPATDRSLLAWLESL
jgi:site-specific recombinase XerD